MQICLDSAKAMRKFQKEMLLKCSLDADLVERYPVDEPVRALLHQTHTWDVTFHHLQLSAELPVVLIQVGPRLQRQYQSLS